MSTSLQLEAKETALVVIDMQNGVLQLPCQPYSPDAVLDNVVQLADAFRAKGAFVVLVNVDSRDGGDMLRPITDAPPLSRGERPKDYAQIAAPLGPKPTDHLVTKHNWGLFTGRISICSCGGAGLPPSSCAASPRALAWRPRRAKRSSTTTSRCSRKTR
ncbi:hypothetical protein GCM10025857_28420 [Alicyclobacillus contaminans]|nr:hypothetical protein GCM10025857_28420 [Alicyclobacillus contaminans]